MALVDESLDDLTRKWRQSFVGFRYKEEPLSIAYVERFASGTTVEKNIVTMLVGEEHEPKNFRLIDVSFDTSIFKTGLLQCKNGVVYVTKKHQKQYRRGFCDATFSMDAPLHGVCYHAGISIDSGKMEHTNPFLSQVFLNSKYFTLSEAMDSVLNKSVLIAAVSPDFALSASLTEPDCIDIWRKKFPVGRFNLATEKVTSLFPYFKEELTDLFSNREVKYE